MCCIGVLYPNGYHRPSASLLWFHVAFLAVLHLACVTSASHMLQHVGYFAPLQRVSSRFHGFIWLSCITLYIRSGTIRFCKEYSSKYLKFLEGALYKFSE